MIPKFHEKSRKLVPKENPNPTTFSNAKSNSYFELERVVHYHTPSLPTSGAHDLLHAPCQLKPGN